MPHRKSAYELARSQVYTPPRVIKTYWTITRKHRTEFTQVLDLGAGDARFAVGGAYKSYDGIELDKRCKLRPGLPKNVKLHYGCAFKYPGKGYSACVGNPPFVRHHELDPTWRDKIAARIQSETGIRLNCKCNLYVYFLFLALLKTKANGLVSLIVPFEWVSRPSAAPLREYIAENGWRVHVYKFTHSIFDGVLTTASISVIDKSFKDGCQTFHRLTADARVVTQKHATGSRHTVLPYENRGPLWAMRGMSPGTQKVFTLTEGERIHAGLYRSDVLPCVTTLRHVPRTITHLTDAVFQKRYIDAGVRCWLVRSHQDSVSPRLKEYLASIPKELRSTTTCTTRRPWHRYPLFPSPQLLVGTGFIQHGPKVLINSISAHAVGAVCGVYSNGNAVPVRRLREYLASVDFERRVVPHARRLRKVEIRQLNTVLNEYSSQEDGSV